MCGMGRDTASWCQKRVRLCALSLLVFSVCGWWPGDVAWRPACGLGNALHLQFTLGLLRPDRGSDAKERVAGCTQATTLLL